METELRPAHDTEFGTRLDPEPDYQPDDSSPVFFQQPVQPQYHMSQHQQPYIQPQSSAKGLFEDDDKMKYIIPIIAFIFGFFMAKTLNPIIIRST